MKINAKITQISSEYNEGFFNIEEFEGVAIGVWGIPSQTFLFREKTGDYGGYYLVSTSDINGLLKYLEESKPNFFKKYEFVGSLKELNTVKK